MRPGALTLTLLTARDIIGYEMREGDFDASPLGHQYTPAEIAKTIQRLIDHIEESVSTQSEKS